MIKNSGNGKGHKKHISDKYYINETGNTKTNFGNSEGKERTKKRSREIER